MILVTVGGQMPFDRLVRSVDGLLLQQGASKEVLFQIGDGSYIPQSGTWKRLLNAEEFRETVRRARGIIAHAGMGSILTALEFGKPILVFPRLGSLAETRNDHQVATAIALKRMQKVHVAMDESELACQLKKFECLAPSQQITPWASDDLQHAIAEFIHGHS